MTIKEARKITGDCMAHVWYREGISSEIPPSLKDYSLRQLLDANNLVGGDQPEEVAEGHRAYGMHCDDRLVAALYVAYHYPPDDPKDCTPLAYGPRSAVLVVKAPE